MISILQAIKAAGVTFDGKKIVADEYMRTNVPHIYAIGDAAGGGQDQQHRELGGGS